MDDDDKDCEEKLKKIKQILGSDEDEERLKRKVAELEANLTRCKEDGNSLRGTIVNLQRENEALRRKSQEAREALQAIQSIVCGKVFFGS